MVFLVIFFFFHFVVFLKKKLYILYKFVRLSVCDGRFGGWGKGQGGEAAGDPFHSLDQST
jgi:hypothetical protein